MPNESNVPTYARVHLGGSTCIPRKRESDGSEFLSCSAPIKDHQTHSRLQFSLNSEAEKAEVLEMGIVRLSDIATVEKPYLDVNGEEKTSLDTNIGNLRARGEW
jgi:hypothetical protein